jgi:hypothetical protein
MAMTAAERKAAQRARDLKKINFLDENRYFLSISLAEFLAELKSNRQSQFDCLSDPDSIDIQRDNALTTIKNLDLSILRVTTLLNDLKDVF